MESFWQHIIKINTCQKLILNVFIIATTAPDEIHIVVEKYMIILGKGLQSIDEVLINGQKAHVVSKERIFLEAICPRFSTLLSI